MLKDILLDAATSHSFEVVVTSENAIFLKKKDGRAERYLILKQLDILVSIDDVHAEVIQNLPEQLRIEPSFSKNCDLVIIHKLAELSDFKKIENTALEFEENPYHFKKYFLYYSDAEDRAIKSKTFSDFSSMILKMDEFADYKNNPLTPSFYSLAARTFIKLPFLEVPHSQKILQTLPDSVSARVNEDGLNKTFESVLKYAINQDAELLAQELINEELENIKAANSGI